MKNSHTNLPPVYRTFFFDQQWHSQVVRFFIRLLMLAIYFWMTTGFINLFLNLYHSYPDNWSHGTEIMIKDIVIILASLELIRVFQAYLLMAG